MYRVEAVRDKLMLISPEEAELQFQGCPTLAACFFQLQAAPRPPPPFGAGHPLSSATPAQSNHYAEHDRHKTRVNSTQELITVNFEETKQLEEDKRTCF